MPDTSATTVVSVLGRTVPWDATVKFREVTSASIVSTTMVLADSGLRSVRWALDQAIRAATTETEARISARGRMNLKNLTIALKPVGIGKRILAVELC